MVVLCTITTTMNAQNKAIDPQNLDTTLDPGENFYQFANGGWLEKHPIPSDKSRYGSFDVLADSAKEQVKVLIRETANQKKQTRKHCQKNRRFLWQRHGYGGAQ